MLSIIVAIANNNVIGKDNKLIWHIPEDLKRFKSITNGTNIIMGRKTFESLGRVLPNRRHIVLCRNTDYTVDDENVEIVRDINEIQNYIDSEEEHFVIGGASIYELLMPFSNKLYITKINRDFEGDTFFPEINPDEWIQTEKETGLKDEKNPYDYEYITYIRR